jgi:hypothetical protein
VAASCPAGGNLTCGPADGKPNPSRRISPGDWSNGPGTVDGVIISDLADNFNNRQLIVGLVRAAKLPTISPYREFFEIGALMVYGPSVSFASLILSVNRLPDLLVGSKHEQRR